MSICHGDYRTDSRLKQPGQPQVFGRLPDLNVWCLSVFGLMRTIGLRLVFQLCSVAVLVSNVSLNSNVFGEQSSMRRS